MLVSPGLSELVCKEPKRGLPLFESRRLLPYSPRNTHACISALVQGPGSIDALKHQAEPQLVQHYQPDSLGYVWAACFSSICAS